MFNIADSLTRLQNGQQQRLEYVYLKKSKYILIFLNCLIKEGFIKGYKKSNSNLYLIKVFLKYDENNLPVIKRLKCISKPSRRIYITTKMLLKFHNYNSEQSFLILSTNKGILSHFDALKLNVGGEIICKII